MAWNADHHALEIWLYEILIKPNAAVGSDKWIENDQMGFKFKEKLVLMALRSIV